MSQEANQFEISDPPIDGISAVRWFNHTDHLITSSWDKSVSLYKINESKSSELVHRYSHEAGVLDCTVSTDDLTIFSGGCDNRLCCIDVKSLGTATVMGQHSAPIRCVEYSNAGNMVISGSWDKSVKIWDINSKQCTSTLALPDKVFAMSCVEASYRLICGIAGRIIYIYDLRYHLNACPLRNSFVCIHSLNKKRLNLNFWNALKTNCNSLRMTVETMIAFAKCVVSLYISECFAACCRPSEYDVDYNLAPIQSLNSIQFCHSIK